MRCPCKDCKDRAINGHVTCHSSCERYGAYAEEREVIRKARQDAKSADSEHQRKYGYKYIRKWEF